MAHLRQILTKVDIFSDLADDEFDLLVSRMKELPCRKGEVLFREGDPGMEMYLVLSGAVRISVRLPDGQSLRLADIREGNFFGEMAIIENAPRSATCTVQEDGMLVSLHADDFYDLIRRHPATALKILSRMLDIVTGRLASTGSLLSEMVRWGEGARKRSITDEFTGLFNRRFLDDALISAVARAKAGGSPTCLMMLDLDHFGGLNKKYGEAFGDEVLLAAAGVFTGTFRPADILARYGGDEFTFILPETGTGTALELAGELRRRLQGVRFDDRPEVRITASIGIACVPDDCDSLDALKEAADKALYAAKEAGRDGAVSAGSRRAERKREPASIAEKNRVVDSIIRTIVEKDSFLLVGHRNPDEDCIASLVAFGLLLSKFHKRVTISIGGKVPDQLQYLLHICAYNLIGFLHAGEDTPEGFDALVVLDTPKPSMIDSNPTVERLLGNPKAVIIEIDHHLEADALYAGDPCCRLVANASSTCELIGFLTLKLAYRKDLLDRFGITDLFSRNLSLSILTGIISDSKMGKFLKNKKEIWYYRRFSAIFEKLLSEKTRKQSSNFSSMEEISQVIQNLSAIERECLDRIMKKRITGVSLDRILLGPRESAWLYNRYGNEMLVTITKEATDRLAEENGRLGLVAYYDAKGVSNFIQFRLRRSRYFSSLDLRAVLRRFAIKNGGGHPGAVGFRVEKDSVADLGIYVAMLETGIEEMIMDHPEGSFGHRP